VECVVTWRRLLVLLLILTAIAVPAGVLRATCAGNACARASAGEPRVPFCPLPSALKTAIANGFREGRSPDVLAVSNGRPVEAGADPADATVPWPSVPAAETMEVPIVFSGTGVAPGAVVPDGTGLDQVAPTVADAIGFRRPFPNVRSGVAVSGVASGVASGEHPRLVLEIALRDLGTHDVAGDRASWPFLLSLLRGGAGTLHGTTGSLPLSPTATLTTIGTGGLPSQHGISGTFVRNDDGEVTRAWSANAPLSVIASLPDDLDEVTGQGSMIGLVATDPADRGLIGGTWYPDHDRDAVTVVAPGDEASAARAMLERGFGTDDLPDVLAVVLGRGAAWDARLEQVVSAAERASGGSLLVAVAGTGGTGIDHGVVGPVDALAQVEDSVPGDRPVVSASVPGGFFLDQQALLAEGITGQTVVDALLKVTGSDGSPIMEDAFQGFAVSFARYC
jgi:hypothetical protein